MREIVALAGISEGRLCKRSTEKSTFFYWASAPAKVAQKTQAKTRGVQGTDGRTAIKRKSRVGCRWAGRGGNHKNRERSGPADERLLRFKKNLGLGAGFGTLATCTLPNT